jgi:hypothetical protein
LAGRKIPQGAVERAVRAELRSLGVSVQSRGAAALAVALARHVDRFPEAAAAAQLRLILADVTRGAQRPQKDAIDEVNAQPAVLRVVEG